MDWTNPVEEREAKMSSLIVGFTMRMHKRASNAQEETTLSPKVPSNKRSRPSRFDEEVQADPVVIVVDSPEQVLKTPSAVGGAA